MIARHVELKKSGSNLMGLCPFHHEKSPSFSVSPDKQLYYCFGCGKGGGAFQFLIEHDGYSFPEAVEFLAEKAGLEIPADSQGKPEDTRKRDRALTLLAKVAEVYARQLSSEYGQVAQRYLAQRKLPASIIQQYQLGFAPAAYGFMQQQLSGERSGGQQTGGQQLLSQLEAVGVLVRGERGYIDRFRNRLMFPIRDRRGKVVGFGGRVLGDEQTAKYLNSPETDFFHKSDLLYGLAEHRDEIRKRKLLLIVEGYMDVLGLAAQNLPIAVAPLGTAIGENQLREIFRLHDQPVFCFDGDRAGRQAAWRALERMLPMLKAEFSPKFLYLPEGEDPDSLVAKEGSAAFQQRIANDSRPVLDTWILGLKNLAGMGADGRARMAKKAETMLKTMTDQYLRQAWQQEAEKVTRIQLQQSSQQSTSMRPAQSVRQLSFNIIQDQLMMALLQKEERFSLLPDELMKIKLDDQGADRIYRRALEKASAYSTETSGLLQSLQAEFPDDERIPRWMTSETISDERFLSLLLDMQITALKSEIRRETDLKVSLEKRARLKDLEQRRASKQKLEDDDWSDE